MGVSQQRKFLALVNICSKISPLNSRLLLRPQETRVVQLIVTIEGEKSGQFSNIESTQAIMANGRRMF